MNIHLARRIPIVKILKKMGAIFEGPKGKELCYLSPLRDGRAPSFYADKSNNTWHDLDKAGDNIALVSAYLEYSQVEHQETDALRWITNMLGFVFEIKPVDVADHSIEDSKLLFRSVKAIEHLGLKKYLQKRGIDFDIAAKYLNEVRVHDTVSKNTFVALGFKNEAGGYELRNADFKRSVRSKHITFIRGTVPKPESINIFDDFTDYLSAIIDQKEEFDGDTIILNSLLCMKQATAYIKNYGYRFAYTWLDNDEAGKQATNSFADFFKTEENLKHIPMNALYENYKDVNEWLVSKMALTD